MHLAENSFIHTHKQYTETLFYYYYFILKQKGQKEFFPPPQKRTKQGKCETAQYILHSFFEI